MALLSLLSLAKEIPVLPRGEAALGQDLGAGSCLGPRAEPPEAEPLGTAPRACPGVEPSGGGGAAGGASRMSAGLQQGREEGGLHAGFGHQAAGVTSLPTSRSLGHLPAGKAAGVPGDTDHADPVRTFRLWVSA